MGAIAAYYADLIILTADNPGIYNIEDINNDILTGIPKKHH